MTVNELIKLLETVEDKDQEVKTWDEGHTAEILSVDDDADTKTTYIDIF